MGFIMVLRRGLMIVLKMEMKMELNMELRMKNFMNLSEFIWVRCLNEPT